MALTPAIFLDKDGTVLRDVPYNANPEHMHFAPGVVAGLSCLSEIGLPLIIVSNQPGVALGRFPITDLLAVRYRLEHMFRGAGATLTGFHYCPHHPQGLHPHYATACACRKPAPGLLTAAAVQHGIDLSRSWFIGDILDDVEAGRRAGCKTILIDNGNETEWLRNKWRRPDRVEPGFEEASCWVSSHFRQAALTGAG